MPVYILEKIFEHHNWANEQIISACSTLSDEQLDAVPHSATAGSVRETISHMVSSQQGYLRLLTVPLEQRLEPIPPPPFSELMHLSQSSGLGLLALVQDETALEERGQLRTRDGYLVDPWVILVQVINHATEHREQVKSMLTALGITPPSIDGWDYGEALGALVPPGNP